MTAISAIAYFTLFFKGIFGLKERNRKEKNKRNFLILACKKCGSHKI